MSFNGTVYRLICIVTVDDSVDTNIIISSQWILPTDMIHHTISNTTESVSKCNSENVRKYVHVEPGKAKFDGYPQELLAIDRNHTVESLSKISPINIGTLSL